MKNQQTNKSTKTNSISLKEFQILITCSCGAQWEIMSTNKDQATEADTCSNCHPFFTKEKNKSAVKGKIDSFKEKFGSLDDI